MKHLTIIIVLLGLLPLTADCKPPEREYYEIRIYHIGSIEQEKRIDDYLKAALIPALHTNGIRQVGVFKPIGNDTAAVRKVYVLIPYKSLGQIETVMNKLDKDQKYLASGADYLDAAFNNAPYIRIEKILAKAFQDMPVMQPSKLTSPRAERVYEIRSYESATEKLHGKKVKMFNEGNEMGIFKRLGFNAVFYSQALTGTALPNLIYMITFDNMDAHDKLWKSFGSDPEWKKIAAEEEYKNSMYKADSYLLRPTEYSDY